MGEFLGLDVVGAGSLMFVLEGWSHHCHEAAALVAAAERVSGLTTGVHPLLAQVSENADSVAVALDAALDEMVTFALAPVMSVKPPNLPPPLFRTSTDDPVESPLVVEVRERVARIRAATAAGRSPDRDDHTQLSALFHQAIGNPDLAATAKTLALRGYPVEQALGLVTRTRQERVFDHIAAVMAYGIAPESAGLSPYLFPASYRQRVRRQQQLTRSGDRDADLEHRVPDRHAFDSITADALSGDPIGPGPRWFSALSETAQFFGPDASTWFGSAAAARLGPDRPALGWRASELAALGAALRVDGDASAAFFAVLGPGGTAALVALMVNAGGVRDGEQLSLSEVFDDFATALAAASTVGVGFDGAALIAASVQTSQSVLHWPGDPPGVPAELLLRTPGFDREFLLSAAVASLELRAAVPHLRLHESRLMRDVDFDLRLAMLDGVVANDASAALVRRLAERDGLAMLVEPAVPFKPARPHQLVTSTSPSSIAHVLAMAGRDAAAAGELINYLGQRGHYGDHGRDVEGALGLTLMNLRQIDDTDVVLGLSVMLTVAMPGDTDAFVEPALDAYHSLLVSGGAGALGAIDHAMFGRVVVEQLQAGRHQLDLSRTAELIGRTAALRHALELDVANGRDGSRDQLADALGLLGAAAGPASPVASAVLSGASLVMPAGDHAMQTSQHHLDEVLGREDVLRISALVALFEAGMVVNSHREPARLIREGDQIWLVSPDDASGNERTRADLASVGDYADPALASLFVLVDGSVVPFTTIAAQIERAVNQVSRADRRQRQRERAPG